jgi:hypothetical protein
VEKPEETTRKTQDVGGWIILKWNLDRLGWYGLNLAQDRDQRWALVNTVINLNLRVP